MKLVSWSLMAFQWRKRWWGGSGISWTYANHLHLAADW